ncbi:MAG: RNA-directed DNA polymerase [Chloroflexota bacterium]|nr:RNA-directed DNA polymerase [Chloroflexota bacterium]
MNDFDWFVSRELGCDAYARYVDDFALFSDSRRQLHDWKRAIIERLARLRLTLHENESSVGPTGAGTPWLGLVVYPAHRKLKARKVVEFRRRFEQAVHLYQRGMISFAALDATVQGWVSHVHYADTWGVRRHLLWDTHPIAAPKDAS